jgi:TonB family protein
VGRRADRGGTDRVGQAEAAPSIAPKPSLGEQPEQAEGTSNMIEDLRVALGWEEPDRRTLAPRPSWAGQLGEDSARPTSPQTSLDQLDMDWVAAVDAQGTPLGVYLDQVERVVAARWSKLDLDPHRRAIGVQGQVMLQYRIRASGRVEGLHVSRSSGNSRLDHMALQSVPARLPRFPRDLDESAVVHALVLRYRNPLIPPIGGG